MAEKFYFISSLPSLSFDVENPMSLEEFKNKCQNNLSEEEMKIVYSANLNIENILNPNPIIKKWINFELGLRNELVKFRATRLKREAKDIILDEHNYNQTVKLGLSDVVKNAMAQNPFNMEITLLYYRWEFLNELEEGRYFGLTNLIIYYLKLQILNRKKIISRKEDGKKKYLENYEKIYSNIKL